MSSNESKFSKADPERDLAIFSMLHEAYREKIFWRSTKYRNNQSIEKDTQQNKLTEGDFLRNSSKRKHSNPKYKFQAITVSDLKQESSGALSVHDDAIISKPSIRVCSGSHSPLLVDLQGTKGFYRLVYFSGRSEMLGQDDHVCYVLKQLEKAQKYYVNTDGTDDYTMTYAPSVKGAIPLLNLHDIEVMEENNPIRLRAIFLMRAYTSISEMLKKEKAFCNANMFDTLKREKQRILSEFDCLNIMCQTSNVANVEKTVGDTNVYPAMALYKRKFIHSAQCLLSTHIGSDWAPTLWLLETKNKIRVLAMTERKNDFKTISSLIKNSDQVAQLSQRFISLSAPWFWTDITEVLLGIEQTLADKSINTTHRDFLMIKSIAQNFDDWDLLVTQMYIANCVAHIRREADKKLTLDFPLLGY